MSDRVKGLTVVLDNDYRQEDIEMIKELILQIKGVKTVKESIVNSDDLINRERITIETKEKIYDFLKELIQMSKADKMFEELGYEKKEERRKKLYKI